ncbi:MAG TPA: hypothetical protein VEC93_09255, partial [Anaerolineae bacterium]|nr:hypothetical protein [Anaerolineae bacterium]
TLTSGLKTGAMLNRAGGSFVGYGAIFKLLKLIDRMIPRATDTVFAANHGEEVEDKWFVQLVNGIGVAGQIKQPDKGLEKMLTHLF